MKGVLPAEERTVTDLATQVEHGDLAALDRAVGQGGMPPVPLGRDLGQYPRRGDGRRDHRDLAERPPLSRRMVPSVKKLRVAGTVHTGLYEFDSSWAYVPLASRAERLRRRDRDSPSSKSGIDDIYAARR